MSSVNDLDSRARPGELDGQTLLCMAMIMMFLLLSFSSADPDVFVVNGQHRLR